MVAILPSNVEYPKTDKGSIIRAQVNEKFADYINEMYHSLEGDQEGDLQLDLPGIESFLKDTYKDVVGTNLESLDIDLFNAGVDSLKAIQMRRTIQKTLDLNGNHLSSNVIYEHGNLENLAKYLFSLTPGGHDLSENEDKTLVMKGLIDKYSSFRETVVRSLALAQRKLSHPSTYRETDPDRGHRLPRCAHFVPDGQQSNHEEGVLPCARRKPNG